MAGAVGGGSFYQFVYRGRKAADRGRVSSQSEDAVYVDSVKMLAGLGSGSGTVPRYAGVVEPQKTWSAKLENDRTVKETYVKEGYEVKVGDKLFTYDTTEDQDKLAKDEIDQERSQNTINTAKQRIEELEKEKAQAKQSDLLQYTSSILTEENEVKTEEYEMKTRELEMQQLKESISHCDVLCELEGVVQTVGKITDSGNGGSSLADSSAEAYITVMEVGDYRVKGTVNEQNVHDIYEDMKMLAFSRVDDQYWEGTISEIRTDNGQSNQNDMYDSAASDGTSSTNYSFYVTLDNSENLLLGQHVYLEPDEGQTQKKDGIWLPGYYFTAGTGGDSQTSGGDAQGADAEALTENAGETADGSMTSRLPASCWVWAASSDDLLEKRSVTLGAFDEEMDLYQVTAGLDEDDYITVPGDFLEAGLPVIYMDQVQSVTGEGADPSLEDAYEAVWDGEAFDDGSWDAEEDWEDESEYWAEEDWEDESEYWEDEYTGDESEDWEEWVSYEEWTENGKAVMEGE